MRSVGRLEKNRVMFCTCSTEAVYSSASPVRPDRIQKPRRASHPGSEKRSFPGRKALVLLPVLLMWHMIDCGTTLSARPSVAAAEAAVFVRVPWQKTSRISWLCRRLTAWNEKLEISKSHARRELAASAQGRTQHGPTVRRKFHSALYARAKSSRLRPTAEKPGQALDPCLAPAYAKTFVPARPRPRF